MHQGPRNRSDIDDMDARVATAFDALTQFPALGFAVLDALPNPVLVKDAETRYLWVNAAFEDLFDVRSDDLVGQLDADVFQNRQAAQCNGGDLRVLESGETDEASETVIDPVLGARETITRKRRVTIDGQHVLVGIIHDVTDVVTRNQQLQHLTEQLEILAATDPLTGCLNRRSFFERSDVHLSAPVGLLVIDLDSFKAVNDAHGHEVGDRVLERFAELVRENIREADLFARLGGEEFTLLLPEATPEHTNSIAQRICDVIASESFDVDDGSLNVTVSVGALHSPVATGDAIIDLHHAMSEADLRLYEAKAAGRNRVVMA